VAFADPGYTGQKPVQADVDEDIELMMIKLPEAKRGFVLLPRRWVVERSFGWLNKFRRLARYYERLPETLAGLHFVVFAMLMLVHAVLNPEFLTRCSAPAPSTLPGQPKQLRCSIAVRRSEET
jgi:hypothetical protein